MQGIHALQVNRWRDNAVEERHELEGQHRLAHKGISSA